MSVTISICDNVQHCEQHGLVREHKEDCLCLFEGKAESDCHYCKGSGEWITKEYPFEINLANDNFSTLWSALGLLVDQDDLSGRLDARVVLGSLRAFDESLILRATTHDISEGKPEFFNFGIGPEQAARYIQAVTAIANEAERRESLICWC